MRIPGSGLRLDSPAWPLLQGQISYWGVTSGLGNAFGTTFVCADLDNWPTYVPLSVKMLTGGAQGQVRTMSAHAVGGIITVADPFTDAAGAAQQIVANTLFCILSGVGGGGVSPGPPSPAIGLWMFGICDPAMAASLNTLVLPNLAGFRDDLFNDEFYIEVIHNFNNVGFAPEGEIRQVTDYAGATGTFTTNNFSANVEANDLVCVIHHSLITPGLEVLSTIVNAIFNLVNAMLVTTETGGTLTTTGAVQDLYINNAPAGVYEPLKVMLDCSNMVAGDTIVIRTNYRINAAGGLINKDEVTFQNAQDPALKNIELEPNRFGCSVTIQRIAGVDRAYDFAVFYRG